MENESSKLTIIEKIEMGNFFIKKLYLFNLRNKGTQYSRITKNKEIQNGSTTFHCAWCILAASLLYINYVYK